MSRISLVEAYDNRDVIGQLVKLRQDVKELYDIVENINPSGDLTNYVTKTGDETIDGIKTFIGKIVADCDIIQNGAAYETHAEQVFSKDDYIIMRDGAIAGLGAGQHSGLQVKLYNGTDDARLAVDRDGVARVGDVGDEQPLLTRDEVADMVSGNILSWDGVNQKAITSGKSVSEIAGDISTLQGSVSALESTVPGKVSGAGNIGSDLKPVKIVNGAAVAVTDELQTKLTPGIQILTPRNDITGITITSRDGATGCRLITYGGIAILNISVTVSGTRSGSSGWYSLFPNLDLSNYYTPYSVGQTPAELSEGYKLYFANGTSYNYTLNTQVIFIHS